MKNKGVLKKNKKSLVLDFLKYLLVGIIATAVEYAAFWGLSLAGLHYELSTVIAYVIATFFNWLAGRIILFGKSDKPLYKEILQVYGASVLGLLINMGVMWVAVDIMGINKFIAKIIATAAAFLWNFAVRKAVIYKNGDKLNS